ncbi:MAG: UDP-N-acetylmuramate dehydrogenase [Bacteroidales bacterium]|jgi:UDP-N-acetylmuramate dehydrogenase
MIYKNISLKKYNTFGLDYKAECMIHIKTEKEATSLLSGTVSWKKPLLILGSGSNILFASDFKGTILYPELGEIKIEEKNPVNGYVIVSAGAGVNWDDLVAWSVNKGFGGLENLSLIPGKVGATPVQNIGAYGVEVKDQIVKVKTISINNGSVRFFENNECEFGYRTSIFKNREKGKYLVTRVYYRLTIKPLLNLNYESLKEEVNNLGKVTLKNVRQGVINIRRSKLPDPELIGNAGSFFKNPVVNMSIAVSLKNEYPDMPAFKDQKGYIKLASGWLIDRCGWKGKRRGDAGVHDKQALVLVNYGKATGMEIYNLSEEIKKSVLEKFGIDLEREVEVVGVI